MSGTSGPTSPVPLGYYDPGTQSLRTSGTTFGSDSTPSSLTLPASGSMRNGFVYAHRTSVLPIPGDGSSSSPLLKTPTANLAANGGSQHPEKRKRGGARSDAGGRGGAPAGGPSSGAAAWREYGPAVRRWEDVTGRAAPHPTNALGRLSTTAVEWMMGLPAGHVTDVPGLSRKEQLHALGNGVVPQQAEAALRLLLARSEAKRRPLAAAAA